MRITITLWYNDECFIVKCLDNLIPLHDLDVTIAHHFIKWNVIVKLNIEILKNVLNTIFRFISDILCVILNLNKLKVQLELWDNEDLFKLRSHVTFINPHYFDDIAELIFYSFSIIWVRQAEFDKQKYSICTTLSLSLLMMSGISSPITLHKLFNDLSLFLNNSLFEQSYRLVKACLVSLEVACD